MWLIYTLISAFSLSLTDLFTKKYTADLDDISIALGRLLFSLPLLWVFVYINGIPQLDISITPVYLMAIPFEITAFFLYIRAIRLSPLSLTVPFLSFTPVFLLITSPLILKEYPSLQAIPGVILIVTGAFILNMTSTRQGLSGIIRKALHEKGSLLMLLTAFIYSITSNLGKAGVVKSSPSFFAASYMTLLTVIIFIVYIQKHTLRSLIKKELLIIGLFSSFMILFHMMAIELTLVSYMISVKRSSLLFSILWGTLFLGEKNLKQKITGGILMVAGVLVITFWAD